MTLPILLIFYVSKWKIIRNIKKSEYDVTVTSSLGVASQKWVWGFFLRRWSLCVNFMTLALLVPEIQNRGGSEEPPPPPPVTDWPKKPSLNRVKEKNTLLDPLYPKLKSYLLHVARNPVRQRLFQFPCDDALTALPKPSKKPEWMAVQVEENNMHTSPLYLALQVEVRLDCLKVWLLNCRVIITRVNT